MATYTSKYTGALIDSHLDSVVEFETDVPALQTQVNTNTSNISTLQTQANTSTSNINTLTDEVEANTSDIATLQTNVSTNTSNISTLQTSVGTNTSNISTLQTNVTTLQNQEIYDLAYSGEDIDRLLNLVEYSEYFQPIGIKYDTSSSSPTLTRIDINKEPINTTTAFFDKHASFNLKRCVRNRTTGVITYGSNARGDGLDLTGASGDVLVEIPISRYLCEYSAPHIYFWIIPYMDNNTMYDIHPAAFQRGGIFRDKIYVSAYEASLKCISGTLSAQSCAGNQPWTGGAIYSLAFSAGLATFHEGETITGGTSGATGIVTAFYRASGSWGTDAAGTVYVRQYDSSVHAFSSGETITGTSGGSATTAGTATSISLSPTSAESYANAIGTGFGCENFWTHNLIQWLFTIEYGTLNSQATALSKGVESAATYGTGFNGVLTGTDSIDSNLAVNGSGKGSGTDGFTPLTYRGIENPFTNTWKTILGINATSAGLCKIINRTGRNSSTGVSIGTTISPDLAANTYETCVGSLPTGKSNAYISSIQTDKLGILGLIPAGAGITGSGSTTYFCDAYTSPSSDTACARFGGCYGSGLASGLYSVYFDITSTSSSPLKGLRFEYIPQE